MFHKFLDGLLHGSSLKAPRKGTKRIRSPWKSSHQTDGAKVERHCSQAEPRSVPHFRDWMQTGFRQFFDFLSVLCMKKLRDRARNPRTNHLMVTSDHRNDLPRGHSEESFVRLPKILGRK